MVKREARFKRNFSQVFQAIDPAAMAGSLSVRLEDVRDFRGKTACFAVRVYE